MNTKIAVTPVKQFYLLVVHNDTEQSLGFSTGYQLSKMAATGNVDSCKQINVRHTANQ